MRILGLTGSIGMGKSTTAKLFTEAGVPVYDADAAVHKIYEGEAAPAIEAAFPGTTVDGKVDRAKLSAKVVHDQAAIKQLEQIVHPMLGASRKKFLDDAERVRRTGRGDGYPAVVRDRRRETRRCRGRGLDRSGDPARADSGARHHDDHEALDGILARQLPDAEKRKRADFVVDTSHGLDPVRTAIRDILAEVVKMPQRRT